MNGRAMLRRLLVAAMLALSPGVARADPPGPVTACVSDTQTGAGLNLAQALGFGGVVRFACSPNTVIRVTGRYVLPASTLIDGGDAITLDGHGTAGPLLRSSQNVILRRIAIRGFARPIPIGRITGSILSARAGAELDRVTVSGSDFPIDIEGVAKITGSTFFGNVGGLTVVIRGEAHVEDSRFMGNQRALSLRSGWVRRSTFSDQAGTAVTVRLPTGPVEIRSSTFSGARGGAALELSQRAEIGGAPIVTLRANIFRDNDGGASAGAIRIFDVVQDARDRGTSPAVIALLARRPPTAFALSYNRFTGNRGGRGGAIAADLANSSGLVSVGDLFVGNVAAGDGGAIVVSGNVARISHALFKGNRAGGRGAAINVAATGATAVSNSLVIENVGSGGAISGHAITLSNVTVANNLAAGLLFDGGGNRIANVILARNRPADCTGVSPDAFRGGALQSDGTCPQVSVGDAFLDPFYVPAANSPALTGGDPSICFGSIVAGVDLAFQGRPRSRSCALGAFERPPVEKFARRTDRQLVHADQADEFSDDDPYSPPPDGTSTSKPERHRRNARGSPLAEQGATPLDSVLASLALEAASPSERIRLFIIKGSVADDIYIDRIAPGRFRYQANPRQGGPERIVVDGQQWARATADAPWLTTPAPAAGVGFPAADELFSSGLSEAVETTRVDGGRTIEGAISWTNGDTCSGKVLLRIDAAGLPALLRFAGACGERPLRFRQAFSFGEAFSIEPPKK